MSISENIKHIKSQIPEHVTLIAVSKTKPNDMLLEAYQCRAARFWRELRARVS
jgi:uncharacterized pyridoxal phosphate-containing UPF0001 family protein